MSAVDLHNHFSYQINSDHSSNFLAFIYAPTDDIQMQVYKLSQVGLNEVGKCKKSGFHPDHKDKYTDLVEILEYN